MLESAFQRVIAGSVVADRDSFSVFMRRLPVKSVVLILDDFNTIPMDERRDFLNPFEDQVVIAGMSAPEQQEPAETTAQQRLYSATHCVHGGINDEEWGVWTQSAR